MVDWAFVLTPVLVLPIVLLYRFVGCGELLPDEGSRPDPPRYRDYILPDSNQPNPGEVLHDAEEFKPKTADVVAYWRLLDKPAALMAQDETGFQHGQYKRPPPLPPILPTPSSAGSESAPGEFLYPQRGLIASDGQWCPLLNGGYVFIPFKHSLYTDEFSIEAWVNASWGANYYHGYEHTLFHVGGFFLRPFDPPGPGAYYGFSVFADRNGRWQVTLANHGNLFADGPLVGLHATTHIVVTMATEGTQKRVTLYVHGKLAASRGGLSYSLPNGAGIFIGVRNEASNPLSQPEVLRQPIIRMLQEVVLYRKALKPQEVENRYDINR